MDEVAAAAAAAGGFGVDVDLTPSSLDGGRFPLCGSLVAVFLGGRFAQRIPAGLLVSSDGRLDFLPCAIIH